MANAAQSPPGTGSGTGPEEPDKLDAARPELPNNQTEAEAASGAGSGAGVDPDSKSKVTAVVADEDEDADASIKRKLARRESAELLEDLGTSLAEGRRAVPPPLALLGVEYSGETTLSEDEDAELDEQKAEGIPPTHTHKSKEQARFLALEKRIEELEQRLEVYESAALRRSRSPSPMAHSQSQAPTPAPDATRDAAASTESEQQHQQLLDFFLAEMEKQETVIAQLSSTQTMLVEKLEETMHRTTQFHRQQLGRMSRFHEVMQLMEKEFVHSAQLRDEEKALAWTHQSKKTSAVKRVLGEQIADVKADAVQQRRRMELKFEKRLVDLAAENQLLKTENSGLKDDLRALEKDARRNKRTLDILTKEIFKLKRAAGSGGGGGGPGLESLSELVRSTPANPSGDAYPAFGRTDPKRATVT